MADPAYLLDSNICIYILRSASSPPALRVAHHPPGSVVVSAIVAAEIWRGIGDANAEAVAATRRLFAAIPVVPFDRVAAEAYATIPFRRARFDRLIAAHALSLGLTLVTNNEADVADLVGLRIENWTLPLP